MASILIISSTVPASINVKLGLAVQLQEANFEVTFATNADVRQQVEERKIRFAKLQKKPTWPYVKKSFFDGQSFKVSLQEAIEKIDDKTLPDLLSQLKPDLVLIDNEQHALIMKLYTLGQPFALLNGWFTVWKHPNMPPLHNIAIPGRGWRGSRLMIDLLWRKFWLTQRYRNLKSWIKNGRLSQLAVFRAYAKQIGFPFNRLATPYMWLLPFTFRSFVTLASVPAEVDLPHQVPDHFKYLGPILNLGRSEPAARKAEFDAVDQILLRNKTKSEGKKLIYASTSSIFEPDIPFFKRLIEAVSAKPDWELILALGKKLKVEELGPLPNNIHAFSWAPQLKILEHADLAITHAGVNTVSECLYFGVPMLVYSGGHIDQNGTAARIGYHNLGIVGSKAVDSAADIRAHINRLLTDQDIQASVGEMQKIVRRYESENTAVKIIEELIKNIPVYD